MSRSGAASLTSVGRAPRASSIAVGDHRLHLRAGNGRRGRDGLAAALDADRAQGQRAAADVGHDDARPCGRRSNGRCGRRGGGRAASGRGWPISRPRNVASVARTRTRSAWRPSRSVGGSLLTVTVVSSDWRPAAVTPAVIAPAAMAGSPTTTNTAIATAPMSSVNRQPRTSAPPVAHRRERLARDRRLVPRDRAVAVQDRRPRGPSPPAARRRPDAPARTPPRSPPAGPGSPARRRPAGRRPPPRPRTISADDRVRGPRRADPRRSRRRGGSAPPAIRPIAARLAVSRSPPDPNTAMSPPPPAAASGARRSRTACSDAGECA